MHCGDQNGDEVQKERDICICMKFPGDASGKGPPVNAGDLRDSGPIPGSGRAPGRRHGNSLQYSCLENPWTEESGGLESIGSQLKWFSTYVYLHLFHFALQQKLTQHCKETILQ